MKDENEIFVHLNLVKFNLKKFKDDKTAIRFNFFRTRVKQK
jgi:hypothetical protein